VSERSVTPGQRVLEYLQVAVSVLPDTDIEEDLTRLIRQVDASYCDLIQFVTRDAIGTRGERPNLNFHLGSGEVLRWEAKWRDITLYVVADWEARFSLARHEYNARYNQKSVFMMIVRGEWGHSN
jgi:hypothetical protein